MLRLLGLVHLRIGSYGYRHRSHVLHQLEVPVEFLRLRLFLPLIFQYDDTRYLHVDRYSGANQWLEAATLAYLNTS